MTLSIRTTFFPVMYLCHVVLVLASTQLMQADLRDNISVNSLNNRTPHLPEMPPYVVGNHLKEINEATEQLGGIYLQIEAKLIGSHLRKVSNDELGVTALQGIYDSLTVTTDPSDPAEQVAEMADRLQRKLQKYLSVIDRTWDSIVDLYQRHQWSPVSSFNLCSSIDPEYLKYSDHFGTEIVQGMSCDVTPPSVPDGTFSPGPNLTDAFQLNEEEFPTIKWQYFISPLGIQTQYPAYNTDSVSTHRRINNGRHRDIYLATVQPYTKYVVIVIDHGNSLSATQLNTAKAIGKHILSTLSQHDKVGLIGLAGGPKFPETDDCLAHQMAYATFETKYHFTRFIDSLNKMQGSTNHQLGFSKAFAMVQNSLPPLDNSSKHNNEALIVYVSRGLLSSLTDARPVLKTIAEENRKSGNRVIINTYAVIDDGKPIMYEKSFLQDIADQNFVKYNVHPPDKHKIRQGIMVSVNSTENLSYTVGTFYSVFSTLAFPITHFSLPWWDSVSKDLMVSISKPLLHNGELLGVVGLDISLADLAEDVIYYVHTHDTYSFLIDQSGIALMHPSFTRPPFVTEQPMHTDIWHLERRPGFQRVRSVITREASGERKLLISMASQQSAEVTSSEIQQNQVIHAVYRWQKVGGSPYTVCMVSVESGSERRNLKVTSMPADLEFIYHRMDLVPPRHACRHLRQTSTLDSSTLFLSATSFLCPFEYLSQEESKQMVQSYIAYLSDTTKLIANPGLKSAVRNDVLAVAQIIPDWKKRIHGNEFSKYIIRRYIATPSGVFLSYPGMMNEKTYDPTKREWYMRAMEHPGRVVLTAPYLDIGGAGYIVTLSHTVYEGKPAAMHSTADAVMAVMGMDFTLGYFYKLLLDVMPICERDKITCFILDDRGYLIAHPGLIEPSGRGPIEQQHVTHKEPLVANDIVNHKGFMQKKACNSFSDRTVQRYYLFNSSLDGVLTNLVHGEHCSKYQITVVPGSNIFLGIVNQTCDAVTAFCPCSMTDRLCLNCHRMEQTECECPCECPLEISLCTGQLLDQENGNPSCSHFPEEPHMPNIDLSIVESLEPCLEFRCESLNTESKCFGVLGCEWCQLDSDGATVLKRKFCTEQRKCFGGVLGARTPYSDEIVGLPLEEFMTIKSTPVGPVAGGIMGCFLVLAIAVYCYRHHVHRGGSVHYIAPMSDTNVRMSQLDNEPDDAELHEEPGLMGRSNIILAASPYRVNTGYRRPPGGDSDHGYSTMTPHEDSEHLPYYIESLLLGKDRHRVPASQQSVSSCSRASSPVSHSITPPPHHLPQGGSIGPLGALTKGCWGPSHPTQRDLSQTVLPEVPRRSSHILAQVQVHVADTC